LVFIILFIHIITFADETKSSAATIRVITNSQAPSAQENCKPLAPGSSLVVNDDSMTSPTNILRFYKLERDSVNPNKYVATVRIDFMPTESYHEETQGLLSGKYRVSPSDIPRGKTAAAAAVETLNGEASAAKYQKTKECFQKMSGKLRSPNGVVIDLKIADHETAKKITPAPVAIENSDFRSASLNWEGDIDCPTIVHETLHLMGLCDGYHEEDLADRNAIEDSDKRLVITKYNCRSIEPESSVMHDSYSIEGMYSVYACFDNAAQKTHSPPPQKCADGTAPEKFSASKGTLNEWLKTPKPSPSFYYQEDTTSTPLSNAQTRLITMPFCYSKNSLYIKCSKNAYRTDAIEGCKNVPPECKNGEYLK
jgi:hypothetical protein